VVPILGTTEKGNLKSNIRSVAVTLTEEEIEEVEAAVPADEVAGKRHHERSMKLKRHHMVSPPVSSWKGS
jgi:diketogulonate reductase-like aldo/keto reductase